MTCGLQQSRSRKAITYQGKDKVPRDNYSMEIIFSMSAGSTGWRRIYSCVNFGRSEGLFLDIGTYYSGVSSTGTDKPAPGPTTTIM